MKPTPGETYERDGKRRRVYKIIPQGKETYDVLWMRPGREAVFRCWCSTWEAWVDGAVRVKEATV